MDLYRARIKLYQSVKILAKKKERKKILPNCATAVNYAIIANLPRFPVCQSPRA